MKKITAELKASLKAALSTQFGQIFRSLSTAITFGFIVILLAVVAGWIPDGLAAYLFENEQGHKQKAAIMLGTAGIILFSLIGIAYFLRKSLEWTFNEYKPMSKKGLILFLSVLTPVVEKKTEEFLEDLKRKIEQNKANKSIKEIAWQLIEEDKKKDPQNRSRIGPWEMPLRAINYHLDTLQKVIVLTSGASDKQFLQFQELVETIYPELKGKLEKILVEPKNEKINLEKSFEDLEAVAETVKNAYRALKKNGIVEKDTIVDITSGQTSNSAAAAILTVLDDKEFQYVSTVDYEVRAYDVRLK